MAKRGAVIEEEPKEIGLRDPLLIRASAGTGKTYQLTGRLMALLAAGSPLESILATTFTRKAAGEILTRVLVSLAKAANDTTGKELEALRAQTKIEGLTRDDALGLVHRLIRDVHRLRILTLDSLFSQLARTFGYELGLPPGWRLTDEVEEAWIRERAIDEMLGGMERERVTALLAMLGKGESRRSVRREMLAVVNDGYAESRACPLEAWKKLQVPKGPDPEQIAEAAETLRATKMGHKSADQQLVKIADLVVGQNWDDASGHTLINQVHLAGGKGEVSYYRKPVPPEGLAALSVIADACRTHFLGLLRAQTEATGEVIAAYETHLMEMKRGMRAYAFDDVAYRLSEVFSVVTPQRTGLRLDGMLENVLLDEFQDTSPSQWSVLKPLALAAAESSTRDTGSFFCVGDTKQAIYGWRGGVAGIFDAVEAQIPGVRQLQQNVSFRSSPVVIDAVNAIFQNLTRHPMLSEAADPSDAPHDREAYESFAIRHFAENFPPHQAQQQRLHGHVVLRTTQRDTGADDDQATRQARHFGDVARHVAALADEASGKSIGILTRTNKSVAWLIHLLRQLSVDVSQEGGNPLTDSVAVDLVLSTLMMAEHPGDGRWSFHVAHSPLAPWLQLDPQTVARDDHQRQAAARQIRRLVENEGIAGAVIEIADRVAPVCDPQDRGRLRQLVALAQNHELNRQARLRDFVARVRVERIEKPRPAQVRVMTVHQAKGLEFDAVVLPELDGPLIRQSRQTIAMKSDPCSKPDAMLRYTGNDNWHFLPRVWQKAFGDHAAGLMTESLCLLYVALTRARQGLHVMIMPPEKGEFKTKNPAALIYHALGCADHFAGDPTEGGQVLFESGQSRWWGKG